MKNVSFSKIVIECPRLNTH